GRHDIHPLGGSSDRIDPAEVANDGAIFGSPVPGEGLSMAARGADQDDEGKQTTHGKESTPGPDLRSSGDGEARIELVLVARGAPPEADPTHARDRVKR